MMKLKGVGSVLAVALLSACAQLTPPPKKAAPVRINQDPYPSTYHRYPGALTVIRGATVFDGEGGRIDGGTVVLADGVIQAVGGPGTYLLGGAVNCGKAQPGQVAPVSHGCPAAVFRGVRILNTVEEAGR